MVVWKIPADQKFLKYPDQPVRLRKLFQVQSQLNDLSHTFWCLIWTSPGFLDHVYVSKLSCCRLIGWLDICIIKIFASSSYLTGIPNTQVYLLYSHSEHHRGVESRKEAVINTKRLSHEICHLSFVRVWHYFRSVWDILACVRKQAPPTHAFKGKSLRWKIYIRGDNKH